MKKQAFLLTLSVMAVAGLSLTSCGGGSSSQEGQSSASASLDSGHSVSETSSIGSLSSAEGSSSSASIDEGPKLASGAFSYIQSSYADKTEILGQLETYATSNYLTGLPLYENGGYSMYNSRITKGTTKYIKGYGFSTLRDGQITADLEGEVNADYKRYYHQAESNDPGTINAWDSDGSQVSDLMDTISSSYFSTRLNASKTGYEWYPLLAKDTEKFPEPLNESGEAIADVTSSTLSNKWRIHLKTGEDGLKYRTGSDVESRKAFDNQEVQLEDYLTSFKMLLNQKNGLYRGAELASQTGYSGIKGAAAFYNATGGDLTQAQIDELFANVGIRTGSDDKGGYIEFELLAPCNRFIAMYSLSSGLYEPLPQSFLNLVGVENLGNYTSDKSLSPVDNILSLAPYYLDTWQADKEITFKKNADWFESKADSALYRIPGIHVAIMPSIDTDSNYGFEQFLANKLDGAHIPTDYLSKYINDARTVQVTGDSVFKLNINSCTAEQWAEKFGVEGEISQVASEDEYWNVKPWMSNSNFLDGMLFSLDRSAIATKNGAIPSIDYFSTNYMSNPEEGVFYDDTQAHKNALEAVYGDLVSSFGYSSSVSQECFSDAIDEMLEKGEITKGQELTIDIFWMAASQITTYGNDIAGYIESAFNDSVSAKANNLTLKVNNTAVSVWSDVYYKHLMVGQFDLGFGSITGNSLDPLNFMEVLKSNNSSGFTLNWGPDTGVPADVEDPKALVFDDKVWAFDALWAAGDHGGLVANGVEIPPVVLTFGKSEEDADGQLTLTSSVETAFDNEALAEADFEIAILDFYAYLGQNAWYFMGDVDHPEYDDEGIVKSEFNDKASTITVTFSKAISDYLKSAGGVYLGIDFELTIAGATASSFVETIALFD